MDAHDAQGGGMTKEQIVAQAALEAQRHQNRMGMVVGGTFCVMALCLFVPLGVWLVRLAMGLG